MQGLRCHAVHALEKSEKMNAKLIGKALLRGGPPFVVVALMLYYTFYEGNGADKLFKEKDRQKQAQAQTQPEQPVPGETSQAEQTDGNATVKEGTPLVQQVHEEKRVPAFEDVFAGDFWHSRELGQWQRLFLVFADEVVNGCIPLKSCGAFRSEIGFTAEMRDDEWRVSSQSAGRYEKYVELACGIDSAKAIALFLPMRSALDALLAEMGYSGMDSLALARQALAVFSDMPVPEEDPALQKGDGGIFAWKDNELEKLSPIRKLCLRMGVGNARRIQAKAKEMSALLELSLSEKGK